MSKYYWNFDKDEEVWNNTEHTIENCINEAKIDCENNELKEQKFVYIGIVQEHVPVIDTENIIDYLREQAYQECGECCEGWLDHIKQEQEQSLEEKLNDALQIWLEETNNQPYFGEITKIKCYDLETGKEIK